MEEKDYRVNVRKTRCWLWKVASIYVVSMKFKRPLLKFCYTLGWDRAWGVWGVLLLHLGAGYSAFSFDEIYDS